MINPTACNNSVARGINIKLKLLTKGPSQGDRAYIKGSEYILFEILYQKLWNSQPRQLGQIGVE